MADSISPTPLGKAFALPSDVAHYGEPAGDGSVHDSRQYTPYVWFAQVARRFPDGVALARPDGRLTYCGLDGMARGFARGLVRLGVSPGRRLRLRAATVGNWRRSFSRRLRSVSFTAFNAHAPRA